VYGRAAEWVPTLDSCVRTGWHKLKGYLWEYYRKEGTEDLVLITERDDKAYGLRFTYNPFSLAALHCRTGANIFDRTFPDFLGPGATSVFEELNASIVNDKTYAPAYAKRAEVRLFYCLSDEPIYFPTVESMASAESDAQQALTINSDLWLAHVVLGALQCCRFEWEAARTSFDKAKSLSEEAEGHFFYFAYLIAVGRRDEAEHSVRVAFKMRPHDPFIHARMALFHYIGGNYSTAYDYLLRHGVEQSIYSDPGSYEAGTEILFCLNWAIELLMACITLAQGRAMGAWKYAERAFNHSKVSSFYGLFFVIRRRGAGQIPGLLDSSVAAFMETAEQHFTLLRERPDFYGPLNMALACMAIDRTEESMQWLREAVQTHEPAMIWLHLWPFFGPLKQRDDFRKLIEEMKLPEAP
jgi:tetratricopeptide (TPR) repeat protein